ncbi:MAG: NADH-quinone oxidoreductase subunit NuoH [Planctomycetota bacterium]|nr:NADH-quinone oxidoreductase subunit NuoH [Planctomycetota bacterium]
MLDWIKSVLSDQFGFGIVLMAVLLVAILTAVAYSILLERKVSAWIQDRFGPNRVGPYGLLQPVADGLKMLLKEDIIPRNVDRALFILAPWMIFVVAMVGFAVIPWGGQFRWPWMDEGEVLQAQVASIDIGLLYILAVSSLGVYGVVLGGWASNNKYSFYGGMRAAAQMLSYEVPMGMVILTVILATGHVRLESMVVAQTGTFFGLHGFDWMFWYHPIGALLLFISALAEANRTPFDLAECEQELVGGYHTEYSAMKMGLFFLAEYAHMITSSALIVALFFGGYLLPGWSWLNTSESALAMFCRVGVFGFKILFVIFVYMWIRWTIPRFRYDQLMRIAWKGFVPISMALVVLQGIVVYAEWPQWVTILGNVAVVLVVAAAMPRGRPVTGRQASLERKVQVSGG